MPALRLFCPPLVGLLLGACAQVPTPTAPAALVPAGEALLTRVAARGVQIYECRAKKAGGGTEWAFVAPEAELHDAQGRRVGRHDAGPRWQAADGSGVVGTVKARADASRPGAVPWLLLTTHSAGGDGGWSRVSSVQRINTDGGVAPASGCSGDTLGRVARVPYTADYLLFVPR
jgi:hypothetical protein